MSAAEANLQAQVESVLGALVKAATVELTKLFESRAAALDVNVTLGRTAHKGPNERLKSADSSPTADTRRSIGVQVDEDIYSPLQCFGRPLLPNGDCLGECREVEVFVEMEGCVIPSEILLAGYNGHIGLKRSPLKEQAAAEIVDMVALSGCEAEARADPEPHTEVGLHSEEKHHDATSGTRTETVRHVSTLSSPTEQRPLIIQPDTRKTAAGENVKFVCPLILQPEPSPARLDSPVKPVQAEPQQGHVSTTCSPSLSDSAVTPAQIGVWERIHTPKETNTNLHMKLKLKLRSPDQKLMDPCTVQLVDILKIPQSELNVQDDDAKDRDAKHKTSQSLPKDLRRHQGPHTGHRLCCFTPCENGIWRLRKVVTHTRDGYACNICKKTFKRRKILRRHERFHTGEKPYSCSMCPKIFALRKSLRRHLRFHSGERPHTCTQCNKSFRLRDNLKAHLRFHSGEKPYSCTTCGKMFRIMKNMEKHQCRFFVASFRKIAGL